MTYIFYFLNVIKKYICNVLKPSPNPVSSSPKTIDSRRFSKGNKGHPNHRGEWVQIANPATFHPPVSISPSFSRSSHWQAASMPPKNKKLRPAIPLDDQAQRVPSPLLGTASYREKSLPFGRRTSPVAAYLQAPGIRSNCILPQNGKFMNDRSLRKYRSSSILETFAKETEALFNVFRNPVRLNPSCPA